MSTDWLGAMATTAWIMSADEHVPMLLCRSVRPPQDRWRSMAKTIEFLPVEGSTESP
jgi:hypothetical protein